MADATIAFTLEIEEPVTMELLFNENASDGWFGGDAHSSRSPRNRSVAQEVLIEEDIWIDRFSFYFDGPFSVFQGPTRVPVTLRLHIRSDDGTVLDSATVDLDDTFEEDWVTWDELDFSADAGTTLIFSALLVGGFDVNQATAGYRADGSRGYTPGVGYTADQRDEDDPTDWSDYTPHGWDAHFWLEGVVRPD